MTEIKLDIRCGWVHPYKTTAKLIVHSICLTAITLVFLWINKKCTNDQNLTLKRLKCYTKTGAAELMYCNVTLLFHSEVWT